MIRDEGDLRRTLSAIGDVDTADDAEAARNALVRTGPTGTHVNDLRVALVGDSRRRERENERPGVRGADYDPPPVASSVRS